MTLDEEGLLTAEFDRVFSRESPEAIQWAFQVWREASPFFPAISDVGKLLKEWHRKDQERAEAAAKREEKARIEEARERGELTDFADVVKQMREILNSQPEPEHMKREREFRERMARLAK